MRKFLSFILVVTVGMFFLISPVLALTKNFDNALGDAATTAVNAGVSINTPEEYIAAIINAALSMIGVIFLVLMIYGGYIWMAARGDEAEAKKAKGIITMAIIGLVVVIAAYAISAFVVGRLIAGATTPAAAP